MHIIKVQLHTNRGQIPDSAKLMNACAKIADTFYYGKVDKIIIG